MNRGAKAVISLALGVILMLGIYHVYRPQINSMANGTFGKVQRMITNTPKKSSTAPLNEQKPASVLHNGDVMTNVTWNGLKGQADQHHNIEFFNGTAGSTLSSTNRPQQIKNANHIQFDNDIDTSQVTNMSGMFGLINASSINLGSHFDTSNITTMRAMFTLSKLSNLNLGNEFNTSKVTDMEGMFDGTNIPSIKTDNPFDTGKVKNMNGMFYQANPTTQKVLQNKGSRFNNSVTYEI